MTTIPRTGAQRSGSLTRTQGQPTPPWQRVPTSVRHALLLAVASRLALAGIVWMSLRIFPRFGLYPAQLPDSFFPQHPALDGWARWDAAHYVAIAQMGYGGANPSPHGGLGFFPLYPLLMRGLVELSGASPTPARLALAGLIISNAAFLAVVATVAWIGARQFGDQVGTQAALFLCVAPFSFFFNAAYTESLFLAFSLFTLIAASHGRWWWAGLFAGLASATRLLGLALAPAILVLAWKRGIRLRNAVISACLSASGTMLYGLYCWWKFDNPLAYFDAQATWGGWNEHVRFYAELFFRHPRQALGGRPEDLIVLIDVLVAAGYFALLPVVWRRLDPGLAMFSTLIVVVQGALVWVSLGRYVLPAAGVYLGAALVFHGDEGTGRWGWLREPLVVCSSLLLSFLAVLYALGFWVV